LKGIWEPLAFECNIHDPVVVGEIPKELNGTYYRNGPNPQYVYSENYHMFEGDGMVHAVTFHNGKISYENRWIRTEKFLKERKSGRSLFGGMRDFMARDESVKNASGNTANTNIIWHHNKLLALNEGAQPVELDVHDLKQCQPYAFMNNTMDRTMMAHPKIDPKTGELFFYSYFGPDFRYFIADKNGQITHQESIAMPFICMMHDFAITESFCIFPLFPLTWNFSRLMKGEPIFKWEPNLNTRFAILPKYGNQKDVIWFEDQAALGFHVVNAHEEENKIILDMVVMEDIPKDAVAFADDNASYVNYLTRWIFDLETRRVTKERLDDMNVEFPRIDERFVGQKNRHAYMNGTIHKNPNNLFDAIVHYDKKSNNKTIHHFGAGSFPLEPLFVPRAGSSMEGDGHLLSYVYREALNRSDLVILDAQHIDQEPIAVIQFPHRVPFGFHGCWVAKNPS
jgi:carotenoid cleavage dioxygenase-like enzyme